MKGKHWRRSVRARFASPVATALVLTGGASLAHAAGNSGGVAYLSWSESDTMTTLSAMPTTTATVYVRVGLVHEVKGIEYTMHWSYANSSGCAVLKAILPEPTDITGCTWAFQGPSVPITGAPDDTLSPNQLFIARAVPPEQLSRCAAGTVAGVTFSFAGCAASEGMSFCLESFLILDGQNAIDSLTVAGDVRIGGGAPLRACGPLPRPRIDRVLPSDALFGTQSSLLINGFNFLSPPRVRLVRGAADTLQATAIAYHNASEIAADFDFTAPPPGIASLFGNWTLIVTNPDGQGPSTNTLFVVKVPAAQIDSIRPSTLFSGPLTGRTTTVRFYGRNFYNNPSPPTVRISNGAQAVIPGVNPHLESPTVLVASFTVPDSLPQLASADIGDHAFAVTVQNVASSETTVSRGMYLYRPAPLLQSVKTTAEVGGNRVEWQIDGATSGSRFRVTRQSFRCGVLDRTATVYDSVFTRGTRFHYVDAHPPIGRFLVYRVRHVYLIGIADSVVAELTSADSVGTRCPDGGGDGGGGGGGGSGGSGDGVTVVGTTFNPPNSQARFVVSASQATTVTAIVYDSRGRRVAVIADGVTAVGDTEFRWEGTRDDGRTAPAGVYVLQLTRGTTTTKHRLVLVR